MNNTYKDWSCGKCSHPGIWQTPFNINTNRIPVPIYTSIKYSHPLVDNGSCSPVCHSRISTCLTTQDPSLSVRPLPLPNCRDRGYARRQKGQADTPKDESHSVCISERPFQRPLWGSTQGLQQERHPADRSGRRDTVFSSGKTSLALVRY